VGLGGPHEDRAHRPPDHVEVPRHRELLGQVRQGPAQHLVRRRGLELHPHEEQAAVGVAELLRLRDVPAVVRQQAGHGAHDAGAVGAGEREDPVHGRAGGVVGGRHGCEGSRPAPGPRVSPGRALVRREDTERWNHDAHE